MGLYLYASVILTNVKRVDGMPLTTVYATSDGFTEPYDIQPSLGYRMYQPTFNPMHDGWTLK